MVINVRGGGAGGGEEEKRMRKWRAFARERKKCLVEVRALYLVLPHDTSWYCTLTFWHNWHCLPYQCLFVVRAQYLALPHINALL